MKILTLTVAFLTLSACGTDPKDDPVPEKETFSSFMENYKILASIKEGNNILELPANVQEAFKENTACNETGLECYTEGEYFVTDKEGHKEYLSYSMRFEMSYETGYTVEAMDLIYETNIDELKRNK